MNKSKRAFKEERLRLILQEVQLNANVLVSDLAKKFNVSESTVRLDLKELESDNKVVRTHGGAIVNEEGYNNTLFHNESIRNRITHLQKEKDAIGQKAASLIQDGDTLLIDGGSTTMYVIKHLANKRNITIITNSLIIIQEVIAYPNINLFMLGGLSFSKHGVTVGLLTIEALSHFHPNKTILGIDGLSVNRGLMAADPAVPAVAAVKSKMIEISDQLIIVCDHTKLDNICPISVGPIDEVDILVTDSGTPDEVVMALKREGLKVLIAE